MDRMGYARGLIRYTTENALAGTPSRALRPRLVGYAVALLLMVCAFAWVLLARIPLGLDIERERGQLYRQTVEGMVENTYLLNLRNMDERPHTLVVRVQGLEGGELTGNTRVEVDGGEVLELPLRLSIDPALLRENNVAIEFRIDSLERPDYHARAESRFIGPRLGR
jgi:polyferredoxin